MKRKHKQILIIWVGLLAGLLIFRGGWMTARSAGHICRFFPANTANTAETGWTGISLSGADFRFGRIPWAFLTS